MRWFFGALALLVAALFLQSGLLAYAMYVLLGVMVLSRWLARISIRDLAAKRRCKQSTAEIGDELTVSVTLTNNSPFPAPWVLVEDLLPRQALDQKPPRLKVKGKRMQIDMVRAGGELKLTYKVEFLMRGYYQIGPLVMESGDLFGLHRRYRVAAEPHFVLVYPRAVPLQGYDLASRRPIGDIKLQHRLYEDPTRIAGVREYQMGDPLNRVHWRATARTGQLHCKIYEPSTIAGATVLLDFHQAGYHERGEPYRSETAITTALSLANAVYEMGQQVGLITNGRDAVDRIRLGGRFSSAGLGTAQDYRTRREAQEMAAVRERSDRLQPLIVETRRGVEQFQRMREILARVELTDGLTFPQLLQETISRLPRDATVLAVLPDVPVETALALGNLRRRGFAVTAVLVLMDQLPLEKGYGRLVAEGITDVRHLRDEAELPTLCQQQVQRGTPYQLSVSLA
jgi:uncharacterized repeat protein (TIGR01451 family)